MRRFAALILVLVLVPVSCFAVAVKEFGFHVNLDRLGALDASTGYWNASIEAYVQTELDDAWRVNTGLGFDFARLAPLGFIGVQRSITNDMTIDADLTLKWIPRHGIVGTIDTGFRYAPMISEKSQLILEAYPIQWQVISVEHRYIPIPQINLSLAIGAAMLLNQGGFFGQTVTIEAYKVDGRRVPFSLFVGSGWFLTAGQFTTRVGYQL